MDSKNYYYAGKIFDTFPHQLQFIQYFLSFILLFGPHQAGGFFLKAVFNAIFGIISIQIILVLASRFSPSLLVILGGFRGAKQLIYDSYLIPYGIIGFITFHLFDPGQFIIFPFQNAPPLSFIPEFLRHPENQIPIMIGTYIFLDFTRRSITHFCQVESYLEQDQTSKSLSRRLTVALWASVLIIGAHKSDYSIFLMFPAFIFLLLTFYISFRALARSAYFNAQVAKEVPPAVAREKVWALHITDIHLTEKNKLSGEGEEGGNENFEEFLNKIDSLPHVFLLATGDLTDQGIKEEWEIARSLLEPIRNRGTRILFAPGNHDLIQGYSFGSQFRRAMKGPPLRANAFKLRRYLFEVSSLNPEIQIPNGDLLSDQIKKDKEIDAYLKQLVEQEERKPGSFPTNEELFFELRSRFPGKQSDIKEMLHDFSVHFQLDEIDPALRALIYHDAWYDFFPLQVFDEENNFHILVLNSVAKHSTLLTSAQGELGESQLGSLESILNNSPATTFIIMVHHSPFKWEDESEPNFNWNMLNRWASLSTSAVSTTNLVRILSNVTGQGKQVILLCGHRHGDEHGRARVGSWPGGIISEGTSLQHSEKSALVLNLGPHGLEVGNF